MPTVTLVLALFIATAVAAFAVTFGPAAARRAERAAGAWAWIIYLALGLGMIFGAVSISHPLLSTFLWTKLTAFILTGAWLASRRIRTGQPLFPAIGRATIS